MARLFLPVLAKKVVEKASQQFQHQQQNAANPFSNKSNQTTTSDKPKEKKKVDTSVSHTRVLVKDCSLLNATKSTFEVGH